MCKFKIIACLNNKNVLGKDGGLLYHISNDLMNFKSQTIGNVVIMGRKTFESLPNGAPLKDRINIIITSNKDFCVDEMYEDVYIVKSIEDAVELCDALFSDKELFVIGGASIYSQFLEMDLVNEMRLTIVKDESDGDVYFPSYNENMWRSYYRSLAQNASSNGQNISFNFVVLKKNF